MKLKSSTKKSSGFSLIELIVAVAIIIIITTVALYQQSKFSSDILINNAAYEVALTIRQAQVYGISSKGGPVVSPEQYRAGYGVHLEATTAKPESFFMFMDAPYGAFVASNEDTAFDYYLNIPRGEDAALLPPSEVGFTQGQRVRRFCAHESGAPALVWECWPDNPAMTLDIVFVKPNPDAHIVIGKAGTYTGSCLAETPSPICPSHKVYDMAKIVIESGLGDKCRTVRIYATGQISVDAPTPGDTSSGCEIDG